TLILPRHDEDLDLQPLGLLRGGARQGLEGGRVVGGMEAADPLPIAVDLLPLDEIADPGQSIDALAADAEADIAAMQRLAAGQARLDGGADLPAIAGRAAPAGILGVEHDDLASAAGELDGGAEPRIAAADDGDIGPRGGCHRRQLGTRDRLPPIG